MCGKNDKPKCGQIWLCKLPSKAGSVQSGYRPVLILSNDLNNTYADIVNVIPITSKMNKRKLPIHVEIWNYKECGLRVPSTLLVEQISTLPMENLDKPIGEVKGNIVGEIMKAMLIQFPILQAI